MLQVKHVLQSQHGMQSFVYMTFEPGIHTRMMQSKGMPVQTSELLLTMSAMGCPLERSWTGSGALKFKAFDRVLAVLWTPKITPPPPPSPPLTTLNPY